MVAVLEGAWRLRVGRIEYQRVGYGSYHWPATTLEGTRWFVTVGSGDGPFAVRHAYPVARRLADGGLGFVRARRPAGDGRVVVEAGEWLVSVWPWVDGTSTAGGDHESAADMAAALRCIRSQNWWKAGRCRVEASWSDCSKTKDGGAARIQVRRVSCGDC